jgi:hypothetical protein
MGCGLRKIWNNEDDRCIRQFIATLTKNGGGDIYFRIKVEGQMGKFPSHYSTQKPAT